MAPRDYKATAPCLIILLLALPGCSSKEEPAHSPAAAVKSIQIDPAFNIELWASEPMFADPVAMEIDEDGRIYVVQNSGYPLDTEHRLGKVWLLADTNGDGKPD